MRLGLPFATLALASAARVNVEVSQHEHLEEEKHAATHQVNRSADTPESERFPGCCTWNGHPNCCAGVHVGCDEHRAVIGHCLSNNLDACREAGYVERGQCNHGTEREGGGRRRRTPQAPRPPPPPPPPPPAYIPGNGRFWEYGSHQSSGTASTPGYVANGWMDPNSEYVLSQSSGVPDHDGDPYPQAAMTRHNARDPHHCHSGWAACCNTEFNCCANCPLHDEDRPDWGPGGWMQCMQWFPECGTGAPHPNLPAPAPPPSFPGGGGGGSFPGFGGGGGSDSGGGMSGFPSFPGFGGGGNSPPPAPPPPAPTGGGGGGFPSFGGGGMPQPGGFGGGGGMPQMPGGFGGFR